MSKVTSKLQVTVPKAVAKQLGIKPGDQIDWEIAGDQLRVSSHVKKSRENVDDRKERLRLFDQATRRQRKRDMNIHPALIRATSSGRGWIREELYSRGKNRDRDVPLLGGPNAPYDLRAISIRVEGPRLCLR